MRGMQGLQDMRASAVEPVRGRENLDVAGRDADGAFAAGQQDFLLGFEPDLGGVELNALPIHGELGGLATSASTAPTAAGRRDVHGHAATGSASASRATTTAHGQRVLRAHFRALLAADLDLALLPHSEVLAHADRGLHGHADVLHVVDADVHHLHHTHVLHVGHAYGLGLEQAHRDVPVLAYLVGLGLANGLAAVLADGDVLVDAAILVAVPVDDVGLVAVDGLAPVVAHPFVLVVLDFGELVLLRVQPQLFGARLVLEADGVGVARAVLQARACGTALARSCLDARLRGVGRQRPGRHVGRVVDAARDQRVVRVAIEEVDDDFMPYAGNGDGPEPRACPVRGHADPAAGVLVHGAQAVPVELHLDAAVFVGPDFFSGRAHDDGGLRARGVRLGRGARGRVGKTRGLGLQLVALEGAVFRGAALGARGHGTDAGVLLQVVAQARDQVLLVLVAARVVVEAEGVARGQRPVAGLAPHPALAREAFLQAHADVVLAVAQLGVAARPFVDFMAVMGVARRVAPQVGEVGPGLLEVVVVAVMAAWFDFLLQLPGVDVFLIACSGFFRGIKGNGGAPGQYAVRGNDVVAQHQGVLARGMLEEVVNAFVLHQSRDKVAIAFVVLNAVVPAAIGAREFLLQGMAIDAQYLLDDVGHGLVLEDAKVDRKSTRLNSSHSQISY